MPQTEGIIKSRTMGVLRAILVLALILFVLAITSSMSAKSCAWADTGQQNQTEAVVGGLAEKLDSDFAENLNQASIDGQVEPNAQAAAVVAKSVNDTDATGETVVALEDEAIADDGNPLASFELQSTCWTHWLMLLGIAATLCYGVGVVVSRMREIRAMESFDGQVLGHDVTAGAMSDVHKQKA